MGRVGAAWGRFGKVQVSRVFGAVWARSKSKREIMQGLLLHPGTAHRARQCRSRRAFSGFKGRNQKGVAKFVFQEKWGCNPDKRLFYAKYSGVALKGRGVARFQYQRTNTSLLCGSIQIRWKRSKSYTGRMIVAANLSSSKRRYDFMSAVLLPRMAHPISPMLSYPI